MEIQIFQVSKKAVRITWLLNDLLINLGISTVILGDSQDRLALANVPVFRSRSKHIDIQDCFAMELDLQIVYKSVAYLRRPCLPIRAETPCPDLGTSNL